MNQNKILFLALLICSSAHARFVVILSETEIVELPRQKTYLQMRTIGDNLKSIKPMKPGSLSDSELATIPEKYISPELRQKQQEIRERLKKEQAAQEKLHGPEKKLSDKIVIRSPKDAKKLLELKLDEVVLSKDNSVVAPQRKLPEVALLSRLSMDKTQKITVELTPGDPQEIEQLFEEGATQDADKQSLLVALKAYREKDYATATTLALGVKSDAKSSAKTQVYAEYVAAHALFQAGFYASSLQMLVDLVTSPLRRSAIGMAARALEKTKDDAAAQTILTKVSLSQIPDADRSIFSFQMGRSLMDHGAIPGAKSALSRVDKDSPVYPDSRFYMGILEAADLPAFLATISDAKDWDEPKSAVGAARSHLEEALSLAQLTNNNELRELAALSLGRLAYQAGQYHQSISFYRQIPITSIHARDALFESSWALFKVGEFNRSLGALHPMGSQYFEARDIAEIWLLRSLNYMYLCRFDEATKATEVFEKLSGSVRPELAEELKHIAALTMKSPHDLETAENLSPWIKRAVINDPVFQRDVKREALIRAEQSRLGFLAKNPKVVDVELREAVSLALQQRLEKRLEAMGGNTKELVKSFLEDKIADYDKQKAKLDLVRVEIYQQATRHPAAVERAEAKRLIAKAEFLPGVFLKGQEILWRYQGELWQDELKNYDYFLPSECK